MKSMKGMKREFSQRALVERRYKPRSAAGDASSVGALEETAMPFYRYRIYPHLVSLLGNPKPFREVRQRIVPWAQG
jgi:hypothetical protein